MVLFIQATDIARIGQIWFLGSGKNHLCRSRRPPRSHSMIWHFLVGKDGLIFFPTTMKSSLSDCTQWQRKYIQSPGSCTSADKRWTGKPSPTIQLSLPSSPLCSTCFSTGLVSAGLAELYLEPRGERTFVGTKTRFKPKGSKTNGNSHYKVCHSLLPSHPVALNQALLSTSDCQKI